MFVISEHKKNPCSALVLFFMSINRNDDYENCLEYIKYILYAIKLDIYLYIIFMISLTIPSIKLPINIRSFLLIFGHFDSPAY